MVHFRSVFVMPKLEFNSNWSALRYEGERHLHDSAVIVLNGHTYHMVVDINRKIYNPCKRCALEPLCIHEQPAGIIERLCRECTPKEAGYWVEDRYPMQYTLQRICENQLPIYENVAFPCKEFDKPLFTHFDDKQ